MKYIDADLLRKEIEFAKSVYSNPKRVVNGVADAYRQDGRAAMCGDILAKIESLQQDKDVLDLCSQVWWEDRGWIMIPPNVTLKGIESLLERVRHKIKWNEENGIEEQEQSEVELEKELDQWRHKHFKGKRDGDYSGEYLERESQLDIARHFYELGSQNRSKISNNSLKELRKEVIKFNQDHFDELHSDMDTIDIVHIVAVYFFELGRNSRKEE